MSDTPKYEQTPLMRHGLAPRAVTFITRRDLTGGEELEGFIDISDAQQVHDLIRAVQKGKA